jgi:hypothetical protein
VDPKDPKRPGDPQGRRCSRRTADRAIEGAAGLSAPLTSRLAADDITVADVPAKLARRVRLLSSG